MFSYVEGPYQTFSESSCLLKIEELFYVTNEYTVDTDTWIMYMLYKKSDRKIIAVTYS